MTHEYVGNLHCHSTYSDGTGAHNEIARAAVAAGLDFVVVTDHNVWVDGIDGYRHLNDRRLLLLTGEEVHDPSRDPQRNHLLVYEAQKEVAPLAPDPQRLIDGVEEAGGLSFLAHPVDCNAPMFKEGDLSWASWDVQGYTGLEIWNYMSEFKSLLTSWPAAITHAYFPGTIAAGPFPESLSRWDQLLASGRRVVGIGGADAHAFDVRLGPLRRTIFPYEYLFRTVNTHVLTSDPLSGEVSADRRRIFRSLRLGHCFVGFDLRASTRGFQFTAQGDDGVVDMGGTVRARFGATLQARLPQRAEIRLLRDGRLVRTWPEAEAAVMIAREPGAYRVEAYLPYRGRPSAWILSNPIYVQSHGR